MLLLVGVQLLIPWVIRTLIATITEPAHTEASFNFIGQLTLLVLAIYVVRAGLQFCVVIWPTWPVGAWWPMCASISTSTCSDSPALLRGQANRPINVAAGERLGPVEQLISHAVPDILVNVLTLVGVSAVLFTLEWRLMLLSLIPSRWWYSRCGFTPARAPGLSPAAKGTG